MPLSVCPATRGFRYEPSTGSNLIALLEPRIFVPLVRAGAIGLLRCFTLAGRGAKAGKGWARRRARQPREGDAAGRRRERVEACLCLRSLRKHGRAGEQAADRAKAELLRSIDALTDLQQFYHHLLQPGSEDIPDRSDRPADHLGQRHEQEAGPSVGRQHRSRRRHAACRRAEAGAAAAPGCDLHADRRRSARRHHGPTS